MNDREVADLMKRNGFRVHRNAKRGVMWTDGISMVMTSLTTSQSVRAERNVIADVERAVKIRTKQLAEKIPAAGPKTQIEAAFKRYREDYVVLEDLAEMQAEVELLEPTEIIDLKPMPKEAPVQPKITVTPSKPMVEEPEPPQVPELFLAILTDPHLSDSKKVRMLTAYLED